MRYHVYIFGPRHGEGRPSNLYFKNLTEEELRERFIRPWDLGEPIVWQGSTIPTQTVRTIKVFKSDTPAPDDPSYQWMESQEDVTNEEITGAAGGGARLTRESSGTEVSPLRNRRRVMVVHGRNLAARDAMFTFLRATGLMPIEWEEAVAETGVASPHNLDAVRAAMDIAQAVVVLLTAEDQAGILPALADPGDDDVQLRGQPRQNVILEAGLAMGVDRRRTVLVELGEIRPASDFAGLNVVRLTNAPPTRAALRTRLQNAGCEIDDRATDWMRPEVGGNFDAAIVPWTPYVIV